MSLNTSVFFSLFFLLSLLSDKLFLLFKSEIVQRLAIQGYFFDQVIFASGISYLSMALGQFLSLRINLQTLPIILPFLCLLGLSSSILFFQQTINIIVFRGIFGLVLGFLKGIVCGLSGQNGARGLLLYFFLHNCFSLLVIIVFNLLIYYDILFIGISYLLFTDLISLTLWTTFLMKSDYSKVQSSSMQQMISKMLSKSNIFYSIIFAMLYSSTKILLTNFEELIGNYTLSTLTKSLLKSMIFISVGISALFKKYYNFQSFFFVNLAALFLIIIFIIFRSIVILFLASTALYMTAALAHGCFGHHLQEKEENKYLVSNAFFILRTILASMFLFLMAMCKPLQLPVIVFSLSIPLFVL